MTSGSLQRQASRIRPGRWRAAELVTASLFLAATLPAAAADWLSCGEVGESAQARGEDSGASARLANESLPGGTPRPGSDILAHAPQLENSGPWRARPILISGASAYRDGASRTSSSSHGEDPTNAGVNFQSHRQFPRETKKE